jgi:DNA-binding Lrp family transcriptional regulator
MNRRPLMIALKPQDTLLALKYWSLRRSGQHLPVRDLADALDISASEVSKGARRLVKARLLVEREGVYYAEINALTEWLGYGVRYAFPTEEKGYGRGMGTGWTCELVKSDIVPPTPGTVWASVGGLQEGVVVEPIYKSVSIAAAKDPLLYQALALVDAIRLGKPRELAVARASLKHLITGKSFEQ